MTDVVMEETDAKWSDDQNPRMMMGIQDSRNLVPSPPFLTLFFFRIVGSAELLINWGVSMLICSSAAVDPGSANACELTMPFEQ